MKLVSALFCLLLACVVGSAHAQTALVTDADATHRIARWRDAKFGLFIHWSLATVTERGDWVQWDEQIPVSLSATLRRE